MPGLGELANILFDLTMGLILWLKTGQEKVLLSLSLLKSLNTSELPILMHNFTKVF